MGSCMPASIPTGANEVHSGVSNETITCASLPSSESATRLLNGDLGSLPLLARDFAGRTLLTGLGLYLAGDREFHTWLRHAVGCSLSIEMFVLWYRAWQMPAPSGPPIWDPAAGVRAGALPAFTPLTQFPSAR